MSMLPQRRKSAEEIAQLRESLGVPVSVARPESVSAPEPIPALPIDALDIKPGDSFVDDFSFVPMVDIGGNSVPPVVRQPEPFLTKLESLEDSPKMANSFALPEIFLEPSAFKPLKPLEQSAPLEAPAPFEPQIVPVLPSPAPEPTAVVVSAPLEDAAPAEVVETQASESGEGKIPSQKHTPAEIERLRRQMAFAQIESVYNPGLQKAHPFLVDLGYIPVLSAVLIAYFYHQPIIVTAPFVGFSLLIALIILVRKPISRHHAGFIFAICFLAIAFGILHYFPQLQHAA